MGRGKRRSVDTEKRHNILVTVGLGGDTIFQHQSGLCKQ